MQDYVSLLSTAINKYDFNNNESINYLRDIVCWISNDEELKKDPVIKELLFIASQKMRVFGYNTMNGFKNDPCESDFIGDAVNNSIKYLYRSKADSSITLDKTQQEIVTLFQELEVKRLLVSAPTSYGKTFLLREIIYINRAKYQNILLVFPTVALLLENAGVMTSFVKKHELDYKILKTVDDSCSYEGNKIFVYTPERALQLLASFPELKIDFFFFDEVYKIDEDYCTDDLSEHDENKEYKKQKTEDSFLDEDRGKTFRIALYLLSKSVPEYYIAGPNLNRSLFGDGMERFIEINKISVKEIEFEPTLRISVDAYSSKLSEQIPEYLPQYKPNTIVPIGNKVNEKLHNAVNYINSQNYGQTLLYCTSPAKAVSYSNALMMSSKATSNNLDAYPDDFKMFIEHIKKEYNIEGSANKWSLVKLLQNGFGIHHGKLPKYIQREILDQFNRGTFNILFCTSTIVEGVNTDARNMLIMNASKGRKKLSQFDIKNIKGRAGRYHHCFAGRVYYMNKEIKNIEASTGLRLDFVTYSEATLSTIDLDNAEYSDLTKSNAEAKHVRDTLTQSFQIPESVFIKNRTISKDNQEKLLQQLLKSEEYNIFRKFVNSTVIVEDFLKYNWISKIIESFYNAGLIEKFILNKYSAVAKSYYQNGFKGILSFEIKRFEQRKNDGIDKAYSNAFYCLRDILEHKIPKMLSLFESIIVYVADIKGDDSSSFSLSSVRRYYETGVMSPIGEALIEYGFPTDAIRRLENEHKKLLQLDVKSAKDYCNERIDAFNRQLDEYERKLFRKALSTL